MAQATELETERSAPPAEPVVLLADVRTSTERNLVREWATREHPQAELREHGDPELGARLARGDDPLVQPVRVTWLPPRHASTPLGTARDALLLLDPRRPSARLQALIARRSPERIRMTVGAPAHALELQRRFRAQEGGGNRDALASFVTRQATLACDRAERAVIGDRYKVPRLVAEQIAASARFREQVEELATKLDRPAPDVLRDAVVCLEELVAVQSPLAIDAFRAFVRPMHARAWTVEPDRAALERLRELNREHALVFLPTHRSYVDPLVLSEVLHDADFPRNHLLGGDNMAFWPMGPLGKRAGVIFIRRNFGDDLVYRLAIKAYFGHLVAKRFNIEWYIEGGRTRTGKLRPPRFGLLHYLVAAVQENASADVLLVPTSILYERLHEARSLTAEQTGGTKRAEGLRWMADYIRAQSTNVGTAQVDFGEPFSLADALAEAGEGRAQLEKVAFRICDGINHVTPVSGTGLVSTVLLGLRDRALTIDEIAMLCGRLLDLLEARQAPGPLAELRRPRALRAALDQLVAAGAVTTYDGGTEPVWSVAPDGHHVAAFYRNGALHHVLTRAVVEIAVQAHGDDVAEEALRLRDLLKFEFFFPDKARFLEQVAKELDRYDEASTLVAHRTLRSFFDAQLVVAGELAERDPRAPVERTAFLDHCAGIARQQQLQGRLHGAESVSRELFAGALKLAANRDLLDPGRDEVRAGRERWAAEVEDICDRLRTLESLDRAALQEVLR